MGKGRDEAAIELQAGAQAAGEGEGLASELSAAGGNPVAGGGVEGKSGRENRGEGLAVTSRDEPAGHPGEEELLEASSRLGHHRHSSGLRFDEG